MASLSFNFLLTKKRLFTILVVIPAFYFWRTYPTDLTKDRDISSVIQKELKFDFLNNALQPLKEGKSYDSTKIQEIEKTDIKIMKITGKSSASSVFTNILFVRVKYSIENGHDKSDATEYYELRFDPFTGWYVRRRHISAFFWKVAI